MIDIIRMALLRLKYDEKGAAMFEYGLLVALIAVTAAVGVSAVGTALSNFFTAIGGWLVAPVFPAL